MSFQDSTRNSFVKKTLPGVAFCKPLMTPNFQPETGWGTPGESTMHDECRHIMPRVRRRSKGGKATTPPENEQQNAGYPSMRSTGGKATMQRTPRNQMPREGRAQGEVRIRGRNLGKPRPEPRVSDGPPESPRNSHLHHVGSKAPYTSAPALMYKTAEDR